MLYKKHDACTRHAGTRCIARSRKANSGSTKPTRSGVGCSLSLGISFYWGDLKEGGSGTGHTVLHSSAREFVHRDTCTYALMPAKR
jgi:hypothetical protein